MLIQEKVIDISDKCQVGFVQDAINAAKSIHSQSKIYENALRKFPDWSFRLQKKIDELESIERDSVRKSYTEEEQLIWWQKYNQKREELIVAERKPDVTQNRYK